MTEDMARLLERLGFPARRMALAVLVLMLRRNGAVYTMGHLMDHIEEIADYRPSELAVRDSVKLARKVLVKAEWPVTIRTEYGIGYSVSWPAGWEMPGG